jgi:hydrogenase expression/formation protein HypC
MCLGIPMQIIEINGYSARCEARGTMREAGLFLLQDEPLAAGDYVIVHLGHAIQKITEQQAHSTWELLDEMLALEETGANARGIP